MARLASKQLAGYFPTPNALLSSFASALRFEKPSENYYVVDPCAGGGEAIQALTESWLESYKPANFDELPTYKRPQAPRVLACELERERAGALKERFPQQGATYHGDAFRLTPSSDVNPGATILYLNPPYDTDADFGRLEHRFLLRFTEHLHAGEGILLYFVPYRTLATSAEYLARHYDDLQIWRIPDEHFEAFGQVLVVGRRREKPLHDALGAEEIAGYAEKPLDLDVLPDVCPAPLVVSSEPRYHQGYRMEAFDANGALETFRPWDGEPLGVGHTAEEILGPKFETAVPPKPAHIALALSSGMFNGRELQPNDLRRHPPLLAKGVFGRTLVEIDTKTNDKGEVTGSVQIERPHLKLTILRLDTFEFHELRSGTIPTGSDDPAEWSSADLIRNYDRALARQLDTQFPAIHDPRDEDGEITLPELARTPFQAQAHAIQAALKLLARGRNPFIVAEVGTGKSTIALFIAAALSPQHHETTVDQLEALGFPRRLPRVRRTLIVCPPHLLKSWSDQAKAVDPTMRVQVVHTAADLDADAEVYVLSREAAKLGHGYVGIEGDCPSCGEPIPDDAKKNARRRLCCEATRRLPLDATARLTQRLATILAPAAPERSLVRVNVLAPALRRWLDTEPDPRPVNRPAVVDFQRDIHAALVERYLDESREYDPFFGQLVEITRDLALALGNAADGLDHLAPAMTLERRRGCYKRQHLSGLLTNLRQIAHHQGEAGGHEKADLDHLLGVLKKLYNDAEWTETPACGEPLYQAIPKPRRYPLAKTIQRRYRDRFDLLVIDEAHEYCHSTSAQTKAAHRLSALPGVPTVILTGSLMGGYASSLFPTFWSLSPLFRGEFDRNEKTQFLDRYGYRKMFVDIKNKPKVERGSHSDREKGGMSIRGEAPGVMPTFILRHLLPTSVLLHKDDLALDLPEMTETPAIVGFGDDPRALELKSEYKRLESRLLTHIRADRFDSERAGRLLGLLVELPSYLDRCTSDLEPFELRYPASCGGELIAKAKQLPATWRTPKERWLLNRLRDHLDRGEKIMVLLRHTGTAELPERLLRLIKTAVTPSATWLDASKVSTKKREKWIDDKVIKKDIEVLLVNPNAVRTGLNNLTAFSTAIWYELDYSATTYRQANGRLHRIGQDREVTIEMPYYTDTAQEIAFELIAQKVTASLQVDGLDIQAALEAAGASDVEQDSMANALSLGQAVYKVLTGEDADEKAS